MEKMLADTSAGASIKIETPDDTSANRIDLLTECFKFKALI